MNISFFLCFTCLVCSLLSIITTSISQSVGTGILHFLLSRKMAPALQLRLDSDVKGFVSFHVLRQCCKSEQCTCLEPIEKWRIQWVIGFKNRVRKFQKGSLGSTQAEYRFVFMAYFFQITREEQQIPQISKIRVNSPLIMNSCLTISISLEACQCKNIRELAQEWFQCFIGMVL